MKKCSSVYRIQSKSKNNLENLCVIRSVLPFLIKVKEIFILVCKSCENHKAECNAADSITFQHGQIFYHPLSFCRIHFIWTQYETRTQNTDRVQPLGQGC